MSNRPLWLVPLFLRLGRALSSAVVRTVRSRRPRRDEQGMVTAEAAVVLPVLVLLALAGVAAVGVGQARVRCADAAGEAARAIARGDPNAAGPLAVAAAGRPVALTSVIDGDRTTVTVRIRVRPPGWPRELTITESATAATEPGAANGLGSAGLGSTSLGSAGQSSNGP